MKIRKDGNIFANQVRSMLVTDLEIGANQVFKLLSSTREMGITLKAIYCFLCNRELLSNLHSVNEIVVANFDLIKEVLRVQLPSEQVKSMGGEHIVQQALMFMFFLEKEGVIGL